MKSPFDSLRLLVCSALLLAFTAAAFAKKESDGWVSMFDGKTMDGWKVNENPDTWKVEDGALVCNDPRSHLFYVGDDKPFKNFEFTADVMTRPGSNAGIYFHTKFQDTGWPKAGFEAQVNNTHHDPKRTASLYAVVNVSEAPAKDDQWFTMTIRVEGKHVKIAVDGKTQVEYTEPADAKPGKAFDRVFGEGTFALQGHDPKSTVLFKNLKVRRLP